MASSYCNWYFSKEQLNSPYNQEQLKKINQIRKDVCAFLQEAGKTLKLPQLTIATAIVYFHRFFVFHNLEEFDPYITGIACIFLAGKTEETPKKLKDVIEVTYKIRKKENIKLESQEFQQLREDILKYEFYILKGIGFELSIEHPYKHLLAYVKSIQGSKTLAQVAWNFVNDSLRTTLCLQFKPQLIASAAIYLASKYLKYELPEGKKPWWEIFNAKIEDLEDISNQILDLYDSISSSVESMKSSPNNSSKNSDTSPLQIEKQNNNIKASPLPPPPPPPPPLDDKNKNPLSPQSNKSSQPSNQIISSPPPPPPYPPPPSSHISVPPPSHSSPSRNIHEYYKSRHYDKYSSSSRYSQNHHSYHSSSHYYHHNREDRKRYHPYD